MRNLVRGVRKLTSRRAFRRVFSYISYRKGQYRPRTAESLVMSARRYPNGLALPTTSKPWRSRSGKWRNQYIKEPRAGEYANGWAPTHPPFLDSSHQNYLVRLSVRAMIPTLDREQAIVTRWASRQGVSDRMIWCSRLLILSKTGPPFPDLTPHSSPSAQFRGLYRRK